jgi:hypothetical protein
MVVHDALTTNFAFIMVKILYLEMEPEVVVAVEERIGPW